MNDELRKKLLERMNRVEKEILAANADIQAAAENDEQAAELLQRFSNVLKEQTAIDRLLHGLRP
jgi:phage regulator Rha-like protein